MKFKAKEEENNTETTFIK